MKAYPAGSAYLVSVTNVKKYEYIYNKKYSLEYSSRI